MPGSETSTSSGRLPVAAAVAQALLVAGLYAFAVRTATGRYLDGPAVAGARIMLGQGNWPVLWIGLDVAAGLPLLFAGYLAVRRLTSGERDRAATVAVVAVLVAGAWTTTQVLKHLVLVRPGAPNTLPSGHTTTAAAGVVAVVLLLPPARRLGAVLLGAAYAATAGAGTVLATWHRPSDVVAAYLVTGAWTAATLALARRRGVRFGDAGAVPRAVPVTLGAIAAGGLLVAGGVLARLFGLGRAGLVPGDRLLALAGCAVGCAGWTALLAAGLLVLLAPPARRVTADVPTLDIAP